MFIRAYLRASTDQQDASRAKQSLIAFAAGFGHKIASFYIENESGATLQRPELMRLIDDSHEGDVLLIEQVDRLSRLPADQWGALKDRIKAKKLTVVAMDLTTSYAVLEPAKELDDFTRGMIAAVNSMLLDMLAVVARKDYEDRRRRQAQGIEKAKEAGVYKGRKQDAELRRKVAELLTEGKSIRKIADLLGCSTTTVQRVKASLSEVL